MDDFEVKPKVRSKYDFGDLEVGEVKIIMPYTRKDYRKIYMNVQYWNEGEKKLSGKFFRVKTKDGFIIVKREK